MNVGRMNHLVLLQNPDRAADGQGGVSAVADALDSIDDGWTTQEKLWAEIEPTSGNRKYEAAQVVQNVSHAVTTHWTATYNAAQRIRYGTRIFLVRSVTNVMERNKELQWYCEETTA